MTPIMATSPIKSVMNVNDNESQGRIARKRMWPSFETAVWLYDAANVSLLGALVVGVVATALVVWMGNVKEEYLRRELADTNVRAEEARAVSAEANARAADANQKAEEERLARVKIEEKLAPRSIAPRQIVALSEKLKPYVGMTIDILQIGESPEITHFRSLIEKTLRAAGWHPLSSTAVGSGSFIGLSIGVLDDSSNADKSAATALLLALNGSSKAYCALIC